MSPSWKCTECGLVNFASDLYCKRCNAAAPASGLQTTPLPAGIVLEDGYVLPPPPSTGSGVWREGKTLIMTKDAALPDQCVKCNAPAHGFRLKRNLSWHHPAFYLVILVAWVIYIVLAIALSKRATVFFGLCTEHYNRRRGLLIVGWIMLALGLITRVAFSNTIELFWHIAASRFIFGRVSLARGKGKKLTID